MKKAILLFVTTLMVALTGCSMVSREKVSGKDLEMTIISEEVIEQDLKKILDEKKQKAFQFTYTDKDDLYICIGYGKQDTGGYSIAVDELYQTEDAIYISTSLLGPGESEKGAAAPSYPYIVVRIENLKLPVIFE